MKILVGVGPDARLWHDRGWITNDVYPFDGVDIVGPCWDLRGIENGSVDEILAKGMIEHLTYHEVVRAFVEWSRVLRPGGHFDVEAPDLDEYIREYLKMLSDPVSVTGEGQGVDSREPADEDACAGIDRWLRRAIYGWQRWPGDEHRSGWTQNLLSYYLRIHFKGRYEIRKMAISFDEDVINSRVRHLWARAWRE